MNSGVIELSLNLALLMILFFSFMMVKEYKMTYETNPYTVFWVFLFGILLSQILSIQIQEVRYDLRGIPFLVGGLYLGPPFAFLLYAGLNIIRAFFGVDFGLLISLVVYGIQLLVMLLFMRKFHRESLKIKLVLITTLSLFSSLVFMLNMYLIQVTLSILEWTSYILLFLAGSIIFTVGIETWRNHMYFRRQMVKSERLEAVSQLAASISHEVRNPLTTVKGFLQLLIDVETNDKSREFMKLAIDEVNRANEIINDYLAFAKPSMDKVETIDVQNELVKAINIIKPLAMMYIVELELSLKPNIHIRGDVQQFHQCILNLMKNAIEAMPDGGRISINSELVAGTAIINISDQGMGMSEEQLHRIGEPFYSTKGSSGTGLGLMVSMGIIRAMGGTVKVDSTVGKGTTFCLSFPLTNSSS